MVIKKIKISLSEKLLTIFIIILICAVCFFYYIVKDKCFFANDLNTNNLPENKIIAIIEIECGKIAIQIDEELSPKNTERFKYLIENKKYVNSVFYRVKKNKFVEAGDLIYGMQDSIDYLRIGTGGSSMSNLNSELNNKFNFTKGTVGMVRRGKFDTENSQFFILLEDMPSFNFQYTPIGTIISGLELLKSIKQGDKSEYVLRPDIIIDTSLMN